MTLLQVSVIYQHTPGALCRYSSDVSWFSMQSATSALEILAADNQFPMFAPCRKPTFFCYSMPRMTMDPMMRIFIASDFLCEREYHGVQ